MTTEPQSDGSIEVAAHGVHRNPTGGYSISIDRARKLLIIDFTGFLVAAQLSDYEALKKSAIARLGTRPNDHVTLCDFSHSVPQSREVVAIFQASLADPLHRSRRLAVVISGALARLQATRILDRPGCSCFEDRAEAERWLMAPDDGQVT